MTDVEHRQRMERAKLKRLDKVEAVERLRRVQEYERELAVQRLQDDDARTTGLADYKVNSSSILFVLASCAGCEPLVGTNQRRPTCNRADMHAFAGQNVGGAQGFQAPERFGASPRHGIHGKNAEKPWKCHQRFAIHFLHSILSLKAAL